MQQMHSLLDIEFDSIHTIDFFRLMQKMPGKIIPLDFFDSNLPPKPDWANYDAELKERLMNQSALNIALQEMLDNERRQIKFLQAALRC